VTLATGISMTIIPVLTQSFTTNDYLNLKKQINQTLQIVFVVVVPAVVGLVALSYEAYGSLYGLTNIELTSYLLSWYVLVSLLFVLCCIFYCIYSLFIIMVCTCCITLCIVFSECGHLTRD